MKKATFVSAALLGALIGPSAHAQGIQQHIAALKQSMARSQADLRTYQWVETTNVYVNGEQKSWKEQACYYGADGSLQKVPVASSPPPPRKFGFRGAIQQQKIEEMTSTMQQAAALVKSYIPPVPFLIDQAVSSGNVSLNILQPGQVVRIDFRNYKLPGDTFSITMNIQTNRLLGMSVKTYMGDPSKPVNMEAQMGTLMDGSTYTARTELQIPSSNLEIDSVNAGYRKNM